MAQDCIQPFMTILGMCCNSSDPCLNPHTSYIYYGIGACHNGSGSHPTLRYYTRHVAAIARIRVRTLVPLMV